MTQPWDGNERRREPKYMQEEILRQLERFDAKLDQITQFIYGNGEPAKGFVVRVDRLEQFRAIMIWTVGTVVVSVVGMIVHGIAGAMR